MWKRVRRIKSQKIHFFVLVSLENSQKIWSAKCESKRTTIIPRVEDSEMFGEKVQITDAEIYGICERSYSALLMKNGMKQSRL